MLKGQERDAAATKSSPIFGVPLPQQPALQLIYDTAPIGLALLSPDCRYLQIIVTNCLGGRLHLDSEPGKGTKIQLVLPRVAPISVQSGAGNAN